MKLTKQRAYGLVVKRFRQGLNRDETMELTRLQKLIRSNRQYEADARLRREGMGKGR